MFIKDNNNNSNQLPNNLSISFRDVNQDGPILVKASNLPKDFDMKEVINHLSNVEENIVSSPKRVGDSLEFIIPNISTFNKLVEECNIFKRNKIQFTKLKELKSTGNSRIFLEGLKKEITNERIKSAFDSTFSAKCIDIERGNGDTTAIVTLTEEDCDYLMSCESHVIAIGSRVQYSLLAPFNYMIVSDEGSIGFDHNILINILRDGYGVKLLSLKSNDNKSIAWLDIQPGTEDLQSFNELLIQVNYAIKIPQARITINLFPASYLTVLFTSSRAINHENLLEILESINYRTNGSEILFLDKCSGSLIIDSKVNKDTLLSLKEIVFDDSSDDVSMNNSDNNNNISSGNSPNKVSPSIANKTQSISENVNSLVKVNDNINYCITMRFKEDIKSTDTIISVLEREYISPKFCTITGSVAYVELDSNSFSNIVKKYIKSQQYSMLDDKNREIVVTEFLDTIPYIYLFLVPYMTDVDISTLKNHDSLKYSKIIKVENHIKVILPTYQSQSRILSDSFIKTSNNFFWVLKDQRSDVLVKSHKMKFEKLYFQFFKKVECELVNHMISRHILLELKTNGVDHFFQLTSPFPIESEIKSFEKYLSSKYMFANENVRYSIDVRPVKSYIQELLQKHENIEYIIEDGEVYMLSVDMYGPIEDVKSVISHIQMITTDEVKIQNKEEHQAIFTSKDLNRFPVKFIIIKKTCFICGSSESISQFISHMRKLFNRQSSLTLVISRYEAFFYNELLANEKCFLKCHANVDESFNLTLCGKEERVNKAQLMFKDMKMGIEKRTTITKKFIKTVGHLFEEFIYKFFDGAGVAYHFDSAEYGDMIQFRISFYSHPNVKIDITKIKEFENMKEGEVCEIPINREQSIYIKRSLDQKMQRMISFGEDFMYVVGLWQSDISSLVQKINKLIEDSPTTRRFEIYDNHKLLYEYFLKKRHDFEKEHNVNIFSSGSFVSIIGSSKFVDKACKIMKNTIDSTIQNEYTVESKELIESSEFQVFLSDIITKFGVHVVQNPRSTTVIGSKDIDWTDIESKFKEIKPVETFFPQVNTIENLNLQDTFGLLSIKYINSKKQYHLIGHSQKQLQEVIAILMKLDGDRKWTSLKIEVQSKVLVKFFKKNASELNKYLDSQKCKLSFRKGSISIDGPSNNVHDCRDRVSKHIESIKQQLLSNRVSLEIPSKLANEILQSHFKNFFKSDQFLISDDTDLCQFIPLSQSEIRSNSHLDKVDKSCDNRSNSHQVSLLSTMTVDKTIFEIEKNNILYCGTECIVNAANDKLYHSGGIAGAISKAAGPSFQHESANYVNKNGTLKVGSSVETSSGALANKGIKSVIHTVAPIWNDHSPDQIRNLLTSCIKTTLKIASDKGYSSISIPLIGTGIYGIPKDVAASAVIEAAIDFVKETNRKYLTIKSWFFSLKKIKFIDNDDSSIFNLKSYLFKKSLSINKETFDQPMDVFEEQYHPENEFKSDEDFTENLKRNIPLIFKVGYQWFWLENDGRYIPFDPDQNFQIETNYLSGNKIFTICGDINGVTNGYQYEIDLNKMTELNMKFKSNPRRIKREKMEIEIVGKWYYVKDGTEFVIDDKNNQIQVAKNSGISTKIDNYKIVFPASTVEVFEKGALIGIYPLIQKSYQDNFDDFVKTSTTTTTTKGPNNTIPEVQKMASIYIWSLPSSSNSTSSPKTILEKFIKNQFYQNHQIDLNNISYDEHQEVIKRIIKTNCCTLKKSNNNQIDIYGPTPYIRDVETQILRIKGSHSAIRDFPWDTTQKFNTIVPLDLNSDEAKMVISNFNKTVAFKIDKIEKIQSKEIFSSYFDNLSKITLKLDPSVKVSAKELNKYEMFLFHGTRTTSPTKIYNDEYGLDMRFSNKGMWGQAVYLAENASYSHSYSHPNGGVNQMFLTRALVGDSVYLAPNSSIIRPPEKPKVSSDTSSVVKYYDSINGTTGGSRVWMLYDNYRVYPSYLISYTAK